MVEISNKVDHSVVDYMARSTAEYTGSVDTTRDKVLDKDHKVLRRFWDSNCDCSGSDSVDRMAGTDWYMVLYTGVHKPGFYRSRIGRPSGDDR